MGLIQEPKDAQQPPLARGVGLHPSSIPGACVRLAGASSLKREQTATASHVGRGHRCVEDAGVFNPAHEAPIPPALLLPAVALRGADVAGPLAASAA